MIFAESLPPAIAVTRTRAMGQAEKHLHRCSHEPTPSFGPTIRKGPASRSAKPEARHERAHHRLLCISTGFPAGKATVLTYHQRILLKKDSASGSLSRELDLKFTHRELIQASQHQPRHLSCETRGAAFHRGCYTPQGSVDKADWPSGLGQRRELPSSPASNQRHLLSLTAY